MMFFYQYSLNNNTVINFVNNNVCKNFKTNFGLKILSKKDLNALLRQT